MIFLVDVNLPRIFNQLQPGEFIFVHDINRRLADTELWQLSLQNDYVILTRDMDFYYRAIESINIPKIVIFRFHNLKLKDIRSYLSVHWKNIFENIRHHQLIFAWESNLEILM